VNTLYAGPEIFGKRNVNNNMPKKWETYWVYFSPVFLAIIVVAYLSLRSENNMKKL